MFKTSFSLPILLSGLAIVCASSFVLADNSAPFQEVQLLDYLSNNTISSTAAWADYDNDGDLDLFIANPFNQDNWLFRNLGNGNFDKVTSGSIVTNAGTSSGAVWGDYDNDGLLDLFVANQDNQDNMLYHNEGNGKFKRIMTGSIVSDLGDSYSATWGDYDQDGFLDLYVANLDEQDNFLYKNNGDGSFERVTDSVATQDKSSSYSATWVDYDQDSYLDLFVVNFSNNQSNSLYRGLKDGKFEKITHGEIVTDKAYSSGATWGDYDNDGDMDVFVSNGYYFSPNEQVDFLYNNNGDGSFSKITRGEIVNTATTALTAQWGDYDNDGDLDLIVANYVQNDLLYKNEGNGKFSKVTQGVLVTRGAASDSTAWGDFNRDGFLDLMITRWENQTNALFANTGNDNHWVSIKLTSKNSNASVIGAKVFLHLKETETNKVQMREIQSTSGGRGQNEMTAHFGLGEHLTIDKVIVKWPSGEQTTHKNLQIDKFITLSETQGIVSQKAPIAAQLSPSSQLFKANKSGFDTLKAKMKQLKAQGLLKANDLKNLALYGSERGSEKIRKLFELAIQFSPASANLRFAYAEELRAQNKLSQSKNNYKKALELLEGDQEVGQKMRNWISQNAVRYAQ